ncbi:hypothetical protein VOLCADRAFT_92162 [Volvox carteri f. nagariensis]|uniref:CBM20 domain-containing protein n=1 Tax=Volvox carteri f. nagariensis TaxID=3068 RepID=D8TYS4_VOLCA|nr:uncharacterized protein VOLCADRAFT_92162 [Volvox carteri f. nagariensis]EFJ47363.1 hypothetical protein VOLCADRAFT_92162 [Volvox carteri f. nagariensis]|eukprot:XP_002951552.1 hypothetical protein VOLCADRAFT_92162 [Volvox carteri f. nagariensis]
MPHRLPSCARAHSSCATPRPSAPRKSTGVPGPAQTSPASRAQRPTASAPAAALAFEPSAPSHNEDAVPQGFRDGIGSLRLTAEAENAAAAAAMVTTRFVVPHFVTKPGQQLFLSGSSRELGEWDPQLALPLEWREGHQHEALVRLPTSRVVQIKLLLKENGRPVLSEEGDPRDVMLMPRVLVNQDQEGKQPQLQQQAGDVGAVDVQEALAGAAAEVPAAAAAASPLVSSVGVVDYQVMCHFGVTEATQILRLPVVLPPKESGDRRVLCKFVVMLDNLKLEPRQHPVVVGSCDELGSWKVEGGVKLMRQVGGYWTGRVELPLLEGPIQAKVVICNADGSAAVWEPGTGNRVLVAPKPSQLPQPPSSSPSAPTSSAASSMMHIFVCRWSQPDHTAVVSVSVEYERADKEFLKQIDAAQREIGLMRRAVTAKSRQCQSLESELAASRRAERALREEVTTLRNDVAFMMNEVEVALQSELDARQEAAEVRQETTRLQQELQQQRDNYERQILFLESKLDEMEEDVMALQQQLAEATVASNNTSSHDQRFSSWSSHSSYGREEAPQVFSRSKWR